MKVLPELLKSVEFGGGGPKAFGVVMKIGTKLSNEDFDSKVTPVVIRLFSNPDRAIRVCLLDSLPLMVDRLSQKIVNDKIFPQLVTGFTDLAPIVREQTLKSILTIITKLSDRTTNGELLKYLAKTANDEQPGIRTNTTICLGKIAKHLGTSTRGKVLIAAFTRSLRDPFVHARNAALMALAATSEYFGDEDCACRIMPMVCPLLIDKEKMVRDQASRTLEIFLGRIRKAAENMPDTTIKELSGSSSNAQTPRMGTPQLGGKDAGSWAGWAISSFTNKLSAAAGEIQAGTSSATVGTMPTSERKPSPLPSRPAANASSSASALHRQAVNSPAPNSMSRNSSSVTVVASAFLPPEPINDINDTDDGGWADMDDMEDMDDNLDDNKGDDISPAFSSSTAGKKKEHLATPTNITSDDDGEPDFAGWLAAQAQKKNSGGSKPLPKGLSKSGDGAAGKKTIASTSSARKTVSTTKKPIVKKVDLKPKDEVDDDGWGDGW